MQTYNPSSILPSDALVRMKIDSCDASEPLDVSEAYLKSMLSVEKLKKACADHLLLPKLASLPFAVVAGGFLSRLACRQDTAQGDIDIFLVGKYDMDDVERLCALILDTYDCAWWYTYGSVLVAKTPEVEVQIICSDRKDAQDVIESFDASYVQIAYAQGKIQVTEDFNKYTPHGLARITRPTYSVLRLKKIESRGFIPVKRQDQHLLHVPRSKHELSDGAAVSLGEGIERLDLHGRFDPYLEMDYYLRRDHVKVVPFQGTIHIETNTLSEVFLQQYPNTKPSSYIRVSEGDDTFSMMDWYSDGSYGHRVAIFSGDTMVDPRQFEGQILSGFKFVDKEGDVRTVRFVLPEDWQSEPTVEIKIGNVTHHVPKSKVEALLK